MGFLNKCAVDMVDDPRLKGDFLKNCGLSPLPPGTIQSDDVRTMTMAEDGVFWGGHSWDHEALKRGTATGDLKDYIYCGDNVELFLALALMRDDTDINQWFIYEPQNGSEPYWLVCREDKIEDEMCYDCMFLDCRKATKEEIFKHFSKHD